MHQHLRGTDEEGVVARCELVDRARDDPADRSGEQARVVFPDLDPVPERYRRHASCEVLSDVRIVDRKVDKEAGTCSSTAVIPKRNLFPTPASPDAGISGPQ